VKNLHLSVSDGAEGNAGPDQSWLCHKGILGDLLCCCQSEFGSDNLKRSKTCCVVLCVFD